VGVQDRGSQAANGWTAEVAGLNSVLPTDVVDVVVGGTVEIDVLPGVEVEVLGVVAAAGGSTVKSDPVVTVT
jgi:hypothetical protein